MSGCTGSKNEAHQSYSQDIQCMLKNVQINSNSYKILKICETIVKVRHNISVISKELEIMKKITTITALRSYNQESLSISNHSLQQDT
ncbi:hypothetical protein INT48_000232 [Thamnidium elegans]|uniref:Uncharacterized protein n=1 Tax=Thamnidium elegans TaxID=101142 RepID=A0A8H7SV33_9FUNG|nr:hypothetical protein INT48_000232 [Thamnidium elegans]